ncbi:MAG: glycosyltransferase family 4 protein [Gemmatimonadaceae bacterium]
MAESGRRAVSVPLRVIFLTHSYPRWTGDAAGSFLLMLARALRGLNVSVTVVAPSASGLAQRELIDDVPVERFRYAPGRWETLAYSGTMAATVSSSTAGKIALAGYVLAQSAAARRVARRVAAHVVHAHWWFPAGLVATHLGGAARRPIVTTLHGSDVRLAAASTLGPRLFRRVMLHSTVVTTVSNWLAGSARSMLPQLKCIVAPMPVATALFAPGAGREAARILFVGRLNAQKGLQHLLDALALMTSPARLDVIGEGPDLTALQARAATLGLASRITWHGNLPQSRLPDFYRRAGVVAVPSTDEGLGLVAVEAQLCATPVVAFDSGGLPDVIESGVSGLLVTPGDSRALAAALDSILSDEQLAAALAAAGRAQALLKFSPEAAAARYAELYRTAAGYATA